MKLLAYLKQRVVGCMVTTVFIPSLVSGQRGFSQPEYRVLSITPRQSISTYYHPPAELSNVMPRKISKGSHLSCMGHPTKIMPREVVYYILSGILRKRGYLDHSHRGSGSTPSDSYFWPLRVLPVLLYHRISTIGKSN